MTSVDRMYALFKAVEYLVRHQIAGDIVECGVWKGGSSMAAAMSLLRLGKDDKTLYLYDTYSGMPEPTEKDISIGGLDARERYRKARRAGYTNWDYASIEEVRENMYSTGYPPDRLVFVKGNVEDTIPRTAPERISLLRLDTDFYESTYHELKYLYPRLSEQGVLILDDYGHWKGHREAVDRYFRETEHRILLCRVDYTGRIGIKLPSYSRTVPHNGNLESSTPHTLR